MAKEICISKELIKKLEDFAEECNKEYGINIWFAEVMGRRWSYIAGKKSFLFMPPVKVRLCENLGMLIESDGNISELIDKAKRIVYFHGQKRDVGAS